MIAREISKEVGKIILAIGGRSWLKANSIGSGYTDSQVFFCPTSQKYSNIWITINCNNSVTIECKKFVYKTRSYRVRRIVAPIGELSKRLEALI